MQPRRQFFAVGKRISVCGETIFLIWLNIPYSEVPRSFPRNRNTHEFGIRPDDGDALQIFLSGRRLF